jgi:hypothetical protein
MIGQSPPKVIDPICFPRCFDVGIDLQHFLGSFALLDQYSRLVVSPIWRGSAVPRTAHTSEQQVTSACQQSIAQENCSSGKGFASHLAAIFAIAAAGDTLNRFVAEPLAAERLTDGPARPVC